MENQLHLIILSDSNQTKFILSKQKMFSQFGQFYHVESSEQVNLRKKSEIKQLPTYRYVVLVTIARKSGNDLTVPGRY